MTITAAAVNITMRDMLEAGVHYGHQTRYWNPKMAPFIYGAHQGIHIINLEETLARLRDVLKIVRHVAGKRGKVLFVGTKHAASDVIREEAARAGMPYVDHRWLGGMLTNYKTIRQSIRRLRDLETRLEKEDELAGLTKKEVLNLMREKDKLSATLSGIKNMGSLPDMLFVVDVMHEHIAILEAKRLGIPVIGIVDTNSNPDGIDHVIPGNDDAVRAIRLYASAIADVILDVKSTQQEAPEGQGEADTADKAKKVVTRKAKAADGSEAEASKPKAAKAAAPKAKAAAPKAAPAASPSQES